MGQALPPLFLVLVATVDLIGVVFGRCVQAVNPRAAPPSLALCESLQKELDCKDCGVSNSPMSECFIFGFVCGVASPIVLDDSAVVDSHAPRSHLYLVQIEAGTFVSLVAVVEYVTVSGSAYA